MADSGFKFSKSLQRIELPTMILIGLVYPIWLLLVLGHDAIPTLALVPLLACVLTLHSSLQHEVIHGHPTPWQTLNTLLVMPAVGWCIPFHRFELLHLQHHCHGELTDPYDDTESYFLSERDWNRLNVLQRRVLQINNTLIGRLLIGPIVTLIRFYHSELGLLRAGDQDARQGWLLHLPSLLLVLVLLLLSDFPLPIYALSAYLAISLLLLRAYAEHIPSSDDSQRSAILESGPLMSLLFLNNNLHRVHHDSPGLPWYQLPDRNRNNYATDLGSARIRGYLSLLRENLFKARYPVRHPVMRRDHHDRHS